MTHELKILPEYASPQMCGIKPWELRKNDRNFKVGDVINFIVVGIGIKYSKEIIYLFEGGSYGLENGYCIMTLIDLEVDNG